jgi:C1A family cysteine protease
MSALPASMANLKTHVESPWVIGKRVVQLADVTASNLAHQTAIKDQGDRGTCTAFASVGALEARGKREGRVRNLSENHAFQIFMIESSSTCTVNGGFTTWKTGPILTDRGICSESLMPYTSSSCPTSIPVACNTAANTKFNNTVHFFTPEFGGAGSLRADNTNLLEAFIKAGYDIVYGLNVAGSDWSDGSGVIDVQVDSNGNPAGAYGGHAMLLVGYNRTQNYFVVKNSWGADWGHDGYAHISYEYLQTYGKYGYAVLTASVP